MHTRAAQFAGSFYTNSSSRLRSEVDSLLAANPDVGSERPYGIIAPHAGYMYSGACAALAYARLRRHRDSYTSVVVISPSHRVGFDFGSIFHGDAYSTPLGAIEVDTDLRTKLATYDGLRVSDLGHSEGRLAEHSLEVQLPFLQVVLGDFKLMPIVMGEQSRDAAAEIAEALSGAVDITSTLLVASSDLSHFHSADRAERLDHRIVEAISRFDPQSLLDLIDSGRAEACGFGPMAAVLIACQRLGATKCAVVDYRHSGQVTGDADEVVGYLAAVITENRN